MVSPMDIQRTGVVRRKRIRRILITLACVLLVAAVTVGLSRLKPAAFRVDKASLYFGTVERGEMVREVRGHGTLVPEQIQLVQASTEGRIERLCVQPGSAVTADTVLVELSNPELAQAVLEAGWQVKGAEAQLERLKTQLASERLNLEAGLATLRTDSTLAQVDAEADAELAKAGIVPALQLKRSKARAEELQARYEIERKKLAVNDASVAAQLAVQEAELARLRAQHELKQAQRAALRVTAGIDGVLQQLGDTATLQVGQRVSPNSVLARVVQPERLKAEIKIAETQAKDLMLGQRARVDTRNGIVAGRITRIDPAAQGGTVAVDIALEEALPKGARPDMNVEGTIELDRLEDVLHVGRPVQGQPDQTVGLYRVINHGKEAVRIQVRLGKSSVNAVQILDGLAQGDRIILSDTTPYDAHDRIRLD